jgi:hypothetical protein
VGNERISIKRGRLGIFGATLQRFTIQRFNVREAICQMLDLTAFPFPANLSLARVRRQKNHSGKLQSADGQLEHDGSIKEPENARG